jgi:hypothetical protein
MTTRKQNQKPEERPISKLIAAAKKPQNQTSGLPENQEVGETASTPPQLETQVDPGNNETTEATSSFAETQKTSKPETQPKSKTRNSSTKPTASNTTNQKNKKSGTQTTGKGQSKSSPSSIASNTKKPDTQIDGLPENQIAEPAAPDIEGNEATSTTRKPENQIVESTFVIEAQDVDVKTVKPDTQIDGLPENQITEPAASDIEGDEAASTTRKPENQIVESTFVIEAQDVDVKTVKPDTQIDGLPENQINKPAPSNIEGNEATPTTRKPENQIVESTSVIEAQDTDTKTVKPDTQINGLPESKIESSTMQETDTPVAAPAVSQASTTTDSPTVVVVKPENQIAVQPENQNKVSDSEPPEEQEAGVNICVKVPLSWRRYWMGQSKMQGVTVTSVIVEALTQKFGKPPNQ